MRQIGAALLGATLMIALAGGIPGDASGLPGPAIVRAATPEPSIGSADTRSAGEAPGFVGSPVVAILAVGSLGVLATLATILYVRLTGGPGRSTGGSGKLADGPGRPADSSSSPG